MPRPTVGNIVVTHSGNVYEIFENGGEEKIRPASWWRGELVEKGDQAGPHEPGGRYLVHESSMAHVFTPNQYEVFVLGRAFREAR